MISNRMGKSPVKAMMLRLLIYPTGKGKLPLYSLLVMN